MSYTIAEVKKAIVGVIKILDELDYNIPLLINGPTGLGKTATVGEVARELGRELIDLKLAFVPEVVAGGIPQITEQSFKLLPIEQIKMASDKPAILFLDEITLANSFSVAMSLVFGRQILGFRLHPKTYVLAACNYGTAYDTNVLPDAVRGRFCIINATYSQENINYLVSKYKNDRIGYLSEVFLKEMLEHDLNEPITPLVNPRTLEYVSIVESAFRGKVIDTETYEILLSGLLPSDLLSKYLLVPKEYVIIRAWARGENVELDKDTDTAALLTRLEDMYPAFNTNEKINIIKALVGLRGIIATDVLAGTLKKLMQSLSASEKLELRKFKELIKIIEGYVV